MWIFTENRKRGETTSAWKYKADRGVSVWRCSVWQPNGSFTHQIKQKWRTNQPWRNVTRANNCNFKSDISRFVFPWLYSLVFPAEFSCPTHLKWRSQQRYSFLPPNRRPVSTCFARFVITDCVVVVSQFVAVSCYWGSEFLFITLKSLLLFCINTCFKECVSASLCGGSSPKQRRRKKLIVTCENRSI